MSNALAIATVTATLAQAVRTAAQEAVGGADVVIGRPEAPSGGTPRKVHVYLYQVTPNTAQRNAGLPSRDAAGRLTQRPQVALDLFYLLAFYGNETELEPQRMLGAVLRELHAHSLLSRQAIQDAVFAGDQGIAGLYRPGNSQRTDGRATRRGGSAGRLGGRYLYGDGGDRKRRRFGNANQQRAAAGPGAAHYHYCAGQSDQAR